MMHSKGNCLIETATSKLILGCKSSIIPDYVISIGSSSFRDCTSLTSITIPNSVKSIVGDAFYNCANLKSVTLGNGIISIGDYAFSGCGSLVTINYTNTETQWNSISKGKSWDSSTGNYTINYNYIVE